MCVIAVIDSAPLQMCSIRCLSSHQPGSALAACSGKLVEALHSYMPPEASGARLALACIPKCMHACLHTCAPRRLSACPQYALVSHDMPPAPCPRRPAPAPGARLCRGGGHAVRGAPAGHTAHGWQEGGWVGGWVGAWVCFRSFFLPVAGDGKDAAAAPGACECTTRPYSTWLAGRAALSQDVHATTTCLYSLLLQPLAHNPACPSLQLPASPEPDCPVILPVLPPAAPCTACAAACCSCTSTSRSPTGTTLFTKSSPLATRWVGGQLLCWQNGRAGLGLQDRGNGRPRLMLGGAGHGSLILLLAVCSLYSWRCAHCTVTVLLYCTGCTADWGDPGVPLEPAAGAPLCTACQLVLPRLLCLPFEKLPAAVERCILGRPCFCLLCSPQLCAPSD